MTTDQTLDDATAAVLRGASPSVLHGPGPDLGDVLRAGAARRVRTARVRAAVTASGATAVAVVAVVVGSTALGGGFLVAEVPVAGPGDQTVDGLGLLAGPAGPEDALPSLAGASPSQMDPATARRVADVDGVEVYAGRDLDGGVCVHVHQPVPGASTSSCLPPAQFEDQGLVFSFGDASSSVDGVLFPDSWAVDGSDQRMTDATNPGSGLTLADAVAPNLLLRVTGSAASAEAADRSAPEELTLLARPASPGDEPPSWVLGASTGEPDDVVPSTTRRLGEVDGTEFWVGVDGLGEICLLHRLVDDTAGASCVSPEAFAERGLAVAGTVTREGTPLTVVLVPDAWTAEGGGDGSALNRIGLEEGDTAASNLLVRPYDG